jgi:hypothetical protein
MEDIPKSNDTDETKRPVITPEDVDKNGLIIKVKGEDRFWVGESDNPEVYDYRAGRFLTQEEAMHRLRSFNADAEGSREE